MFPRDLIEKGHEFTHNEYLKQKYIAAIERSTTEL